MKIGTRTLLFGTHNIVIHPLLVAIAWWKLYSFPWSPKLWIAFIVHDWGYWGKPNIDGKEGKTHPELGAKLMHKWFDKGNSNEWYNFMIGHSRSYSTGKDIALSKLAVADKMVMLFYPAWLFVFIAQLTGELKEYIGTPAYYEKYNMRKYRILWYKDIKLYLYAWIKVAKTLY